MISFCEYNFHMCYFEIEKTKAKIETEKVKLLQEVSNQNEEITKILNEIEVMF